MVVVAGGLGGCGGWGVGGLGGWVVGGPIGGAGGDFFFYRG